MHTVKKLTLIDHENATMGPGAAPHLYGVLHDVLISLLPEGLGHIVVGSSCGGSPVMFAASGVQGARHVFQAGRDGAELALVKFVNDHYADLDVDELVIASGDEAFLELAVAMQRRGTKITVVANRGTLAKYLELIADEVHYLPRDWQMTFAA